MKIAVTGFRGKLGSRLVKLGVVPIRANILYPRQIRRELDSIKPDVVIHAAGMSSVAECEKDYDRAIAINTHGTANVFESVADLLGEQRCVLISSDQVFDGEAGDYKEEDEPNPIHEYGLTKFAAEALAKVYANKVIRLSRCVDANEKDISEYLNMLQKGQEIHVPTFIYRNYSHLDFVADAIFIYANSFEKMPSILHIGGSSTMSFYDFMQQVANRFGLDWSLVLPRTQDSGESKRPRKCGLNVQKAIDLAIPIYDYNETIDRMKMEWNSKQAS